MSSYKEENSLEERKSESGRIRSRYPDRIPIICDKAEKSKIAGIDKKKFLVPQDLTVGQFSYIIRKRIKLLPEQAMFILCKNMMLPTSMSMSNVYEESKDEDGFLYLTSSGESTFGF
ncbi:autophagy-related protein [Anaeramoeba flamelloides]|uniref:Autophagy-related protein n=1 Tax=Anaeramoeba flamelloides TaxID=1746091 RepID=A0ABQ8XFN8_9EUKA|nr:autophagy-related protein [Anaeramoeba flamelloides]